MMWANIIPMKSALFNQYWMIKSVESWWEIDEKQHVQLFWKLRVIGKFGDNYVNYMYLNLLSLKSI